MRQPQKRMPRMHLPVIVLARTLLVKAITQRRAIRRSRRQAEIDDTDLAQRVRQTGEW